MLPLAAAAGIPEHGSLAWPLILAVLLVIQVRRMQSPEVNRWGGWSLVLYYLAALVLWLGVHLRQQVSASAPVAWLIATAATLGSAALLVVALVLGLQGLSVVRAGRRTGLSARAGGAGWAVGLSAVTLLLLLGGAVSGLVGRLSEVQRSRVAGPLASAPLVRDEPHNFSFQPPPGWKPLDAKQVNAQAAVAYVHGTAASYFLIIAEVVGEMESEDVSRAAEIHLRGASERLTVRERGPRTVNGLPGIQLVTAAVVKGKEYVYVNWAVSRNGWAYQLVTWGPARDAAAIARDAEAVSRGFELLDPERRPPVPVSAAPPEQLWAFRSPAWHYRAVLDRRAFSEWTALDKDFPKADFGARCGPRCAVAVFPVRLPSPRPSLDAIARGLADMAGLEFPGDGYSDRRPLQVGSADGFEVSLHQDEDKGKGWDWRLRVLADGRRAWLVAGFSTPGDAEGASRRDAGLQAVSFDPALPGDEPPAPTGHRDTVRLARALNEMGLAEADGGHDADAARLFTEAWRLTPDDVVLLRNAASASADAERYAEGLALVEEGRPRFPGDARLTALRALLASHAGRASEALRDYEQLFAGGFAGDGHLRRYAELLEGEGKRGEAISAVAAYRKRHDGRKPALLHAELLGRAGKARAQVDVLRAAYRKLGDAWVGYELADALLDQGHKAEALREAAAMARRFPGNGSMLELRGRCELALGRTEDAQRSLEAALEHDPTNEQARRFLDHVSGLLGQGQNASIKEPIEEVAVPEGLLGPAAVGPAPEGYGAWFQERLAAYSFRKGQPLRRTDVWRGHAADAAGVEDLSRVQVSFDPLSERVFVNRVVVRDGKGTVVSRGKPGDWYVEDKASGEQGTQRRTLHVQVAGLRPGLDVEVVVTRRSAGPRDRMEWEELPLASGLPRLRSAVVLTGDLDAIATAASPGVETVHGPGALAFVARDTAVFRAEPLREEFQQWLPVVWLGPAGTTWAAEAQRYEAEIAGVDRPDPGAERIGAEAVRGAGTAQSKLFALARWVQQGLTYRAIEFGRRAHVPHTVPEILGSRFGDCKDHALLLKRLLLAQGVPAQLALVRTDGPVRAELPSVDQFDHMVVYVPGVGGGLFVDTTDKGAAPGQPPPGLGRKQALVLEGAKSRLVPVPDELPDRLTSERIVTMGESELDVREKLQLEGPLATWMRDYLSGTPSADRVQAIQSFLEEADPGLRVTSLQLDGLDAVERPLLLDLRYLLRNRVRRSGDELTASLPALWERRQLSASAVDRRASPFALHAATMRSVVELRTDGKVAAPGPAAPGTGAFVSWRQASASDGGGVRIEATVERPEAHHPAPRWDDYRLEVDRALSALEMTVNVRRAKPASP
jgi:tetratricopeptide (TPR) repeat protein